METGKAGRVPTNSLISPMAVQTPEQLTPQQATMTVTHVDDDTKVTTRMVLLELRFNPGDNAKAVNDRFRKLWQTLFSGPTAPPAPTLVARHYWRCVLTTEQMLALAAADIAAAESRSPQGVPSIYRIWPDYVMRGHLDRSVTTVKADAAVRTYGCAGNGIVWAVLDSGIDARHPHFTRYGNLTDPLVKQWHRDFTIGNTTRGGPLTDVHGHGTHVAGIIAGVAPDHDELLIASNEPTDQDLPRWALRTLDPGTELSGVAPQAKLVSLKVLDDDGNTVSSAVLEAIDWVRRVNSGGRSIQIHGVNLSLGSDWPPSDCAAGQSPICRELDLLAATGVVVVVSAGNAGAAGTQSGPSSDVRGQLSTITDPGNAASAITVGSVHRYKPHTYGVSFDSSKGPTLDGRKKPDLVAPGERITSAATGSFVAGVDVLAPQNPKHLARYREDSGTSMAAAHVSGAIAAFMSARTEYIGQPQLIKQLLMDSATDLGRHEFYQGAGLIDLMRALSNV